MAKEFKGELRHALRAMQVLVDTKGTARKKEKWEEILTFIHDLEMENFNLKEKIKNMAEKG